MTLIIEDNIIQETRANAQIKKRGNQMKSFEKFEPKKELILVVASLLWMWFSYYTSNNIFDENMIYLSIVTVLLTMIGSCVLLPVWWIAVHNKEGIEGLNITGKRIAITIVFTIILGAWRFTELKDYLDSDNLIRTLLFNALSIWEVCFIFGWLFTRYERSFGKLPAIILTSLSVGLYHIGTLTTKNILSLCLVILICGLCYMITENIFTLWPIYWPIGCSASTLKSDMEFSNVYIIMSAFVLVIQIVIIVFLQKKYLRTSKE